jgi:hypothetical protein
MQIMYKMFLLLRMFCLNRKGMDALHKAQNPIG